jgi:glycosyltransferase involved in cell wall biosynthesis
MRIGIDTHFIGSVRATGNRTYTAELVQALTAIDDQNEYILYAINNHRYYQQFAGNSRVAVRRALSVNGVIRNFASLPLAVARDAPDVTHLQFILPPGLRSPAVLAVHDLYYLHLGRPALGERILSWLTVWSIRRASHIVTLSAYSKQDIVQRCAVNPDRIAVVPLAAHRRFAPIQHDSARQSILQRLRIQGEYVLYVGRTEDPRKNLRTLIDAYAVLRSQRATDALLVIAGRQGVGTQDIQRQISDLGLEQDVLLPGIVPDTDLPALLSGASLFVYVSSFEGFGLPVLEAMACGTPVITANTTSLPEVAGDAALLVTPGNVDELTRAMRRLLSEPELRQQLREHGLERARLFSWEKTAQATLEIYQQVAQSVSRSD